MEIRLAQAQDIDAWMALVERVRDAFPGLETAEAIAEHRATVLHFILTINRVNATKALARLRDEDIIVSHRKWIEIIDPAALERHCSQETLPT